MIRAIDKGVVHRICSGQVILDLATAVKELLENAIDAGASTVEVNLVVWSRSLEAQHAQPQVLREGATQGIWKRACRSC